MINLFNQDYNETPKEFSKTKGSERIQINNILSAITIAVLTILAQNQDSNSYYTIILSELSAAIPILILSSLAYSKICYRSHNEYIYWNGSGWLTHTIGYFLLIDGIFLLLYSHSFIVPAKTLLITTLVLIIIYSILDIVTSPDKSVRIERTKEKAIKLTIYLLILLLGAIFPIYY